METTTTRWFKRFGILAIVVSAGWVIRVIIAKGFHLENRDPAFEAEHAAA